MRKEFDSIVSFVAGQNERKKLFTAGPASLLPENLTGLRPCFGRGDADYAEVENLVLSALKTMSGHAHIVRMQGSASLALEIVTLNFIYGRVLIVSTGYYSERLAWLAASAHRRLAEITSIIKINWDELDDVTGCFDWVMACYTETSCGLKIPIGSLRKLADRLGARLMLDATASIGLEEGHDSADVIAYSSCKGLFGLTGGAFIAYHAPPSVEIDSFFLNLTNHIEKMMTGPYHAIASLVDVLPLHASFRTAVVENKKEFIRRMKNHVSLPDQFQPLLCTHVLCRIFSNDCRAVLYEPRSNKGGSVVCHLGEVHLGEVARGQILDLLEFEE